MSVHEPENIVQDAERSLRDLVRAEFHDLASICTNLGGNEDGLDASEVTEWADELVDLFLRLRGPIPVTVDDEHAQPVTGYLLRLPEEWQQEYEGPVWLCLAPFAAEFERRAPLWVGRIGEIAHGIQVRASWLGETVTQPRVEQMIRGYECTRARWWAEAYRVALKAER